MSLEDFRPPYPTLGEVLREAAHLLDTKPTLKRKVYYPEYRLPANLDRLAREKDFDYTLIEPIKDIIFQIPFADSNPSFSTYVRDYGELLINEYLNLIKNVTLAGFGREESIPWLVEHRSAYFLLYMVFLRQDEYADKVKTLDLIRDELPLRSFFLWVDEKYPEWTEFRKTFGNQKEAKTERDKVWKWTNGVDIPSSSSLWGGAGMFTEFYREQEIDTENQKIINESLFFAKMLQIYFKSEHSESSRTNMQQMEKRQYRYLSDYDILRSYKSIPFEVIDKKVIKYVGLCYEILEILINTKSRNTEDKSKIYDLIVEAEAEAEAIKEYHPNWWEIKRFHGMWHVFNGDLVSAIPQYAHAVEGVIYSGSENSRKILREAVAVCCTAYIQGVRKAEGKNLKSLIRRLKSQGSAFGYYPPWTNKENNIPTIEIRTGASYFWQYFPKSKCF